MSEYRFVEIQFGEDSISNNGNLMEELKKQFPKSVHIMNVINIKSMEMYSVENVESFRVFSYEKGLIKDQLTLNSWERDWTDLIAPLILVSIIKTKRSVDRKAAFEYIQMFSREPLQENDDSLVSAFSSLCPLPEDRNEPLIFATMNKTYLPFLEKVAEKKGMKAKAFSNWTMCLPLEKALEWEFGLSPLIHKLNPEDSALVNKHWKFGSDKDDTKLHIQDCINHSITAGLYPEEGKDPIAWAISMPSGTINAVHTIEKERRKGFAEEVLKFMAVNFAKKGLYPICEIEVDNLTSKMFMDKLVFQLAFDAAWVDFTF